MTYRQDFNLPAELLEQVHAQGLEILPERIRVVLNAATQAERGEYLQAKPYQHTDERRGYANGYKPKTMRTLVDDITFAVPQVREDGQIRDLAVLVAVGINPQGKREILGVSVSLSEHEAARIQLLLEK
jgi:transposase-like protein